MRIRSDRKIHVGALHLVEVADRVLGSDASPRAKYAYLSNLLSRLGSAMGPAETSSLRLECFQRLFQEPGGEESTDDDGWRLALQ